MGLSTVLALYANGRTTGCVLEIGEGSSHTTPIHEGYIVEHALNRVDMAGQDVSKNLMGLL